MRSIYPKIYALGRISALYLCLQGIAYADNTEFFEQKIRPILVEKCYGCHSVAADPLKGELRMDSAAGMGKGGKSGLPAVTPGDTEKSRLIEAIRRGNPDLQMPPKEALSAQEVEAFEHWVKSGAVFPESSAPIDLMATARKHWAFQPLSPQIPPAVQNTAWPRTDIDHFVLAKLESQGLTPSPEADRRMLIRRLSFDLLGLPPTPEEVATFIADPTANAYEKLLERYLASPHYGERWARHWLDVARYADTKGYIYDGREEAQFTHSHVYRDWVVDALNRDMPYDDFIRMQLAADAYTGKASRANLAAMGFLTLGQRFLGVVPDIIDDRIDTVTRGLMGLTVSCARCHDHKFDPIPTADYYSLYGVFSASSERTLPLSPKDFEDAKYAAFTEEMKKREEKLRDTFQRKSAELEARLRMQVDRYLSAVPTANSLPTDDFYQILNTEDLNPTVVRRWAAYIARQSENDPVFGLWNRLSAFPEDAFVDAIQSDWVNHPDINTAIAETIQTSIPKNRDEVISVYGAVFSDVNEEWLKLLKQAECSGTEAPLALPDTARETIRQHLYKADSPLMVPDAAIVDVEWMFDEPTRVELGKLNSEIENWIINAEIAPSYSTILVDKAELPMARVFKRGNPASPGPEVPRQFLALFEGENRKPFTEGSGRRNLAEAIVRPDNPLTARVLVNRVWAWHFGKGLVATPSDFGTRSAAPSHPELLDWMAQNFVDQGWSLKALHRQILLSATYRQESTTGNAENAIALDPENSLLWHFNSHRLDFESLRDALLFASGELDLTVGGRPVDITKTPYSKRRTLYGLIDRRYLPGIYRVFDFPNPDMHNPQRIDTTAPQQALYLMNNPFVQEEARALAARAQNIVDVTFGERIAWMYERAFQRSATADECAQSLRFIEEATASTLPPSAPLPPSTWTYGYGKFDEKTGKLESFKPLPHFTGTAWQGGESWPDATLGYAQLTAEGGHPGNDLDHAVVRRWTAPVAGKVRIEGRIIHARTEGDGIRARVLSSRQGVLGEWYLHNTETDTNFYGIMVESGDTIDFVVDINKVLNSDEHLWIPVVTLEEGKVWNAKEEFAGPYEAPPKPLTAWEKFAQVLLSSNEFMFVD